MVAFDLPVGSSLLLLDEPAMVPPYLDPACANPHHRVPAAMRRLAPYYGLAVSGRLPASMLCELVGARASNDPAPVTCVGHHGLETRWPDGTMSIHAQATDERTSRLARFAVRVRDLYGSRLTDYGASLNAWPRCLAIDWAVVEERSACSQIAAKVRRWALRQEMHCIWSGIALDVTPVELPELDMLTELVRGLEARGRWIATLAYLHSADPVAKGELLSELVERGVVADAIAIRVAPAGSGPDHHRAARAAGREVLVPEPLDGVSGAVRWLEDLAEACERGTRGGPR